MDQPDRNRPARQPVYDLGNRANIIFLTVCTDHRKPLLANDQAHKLLVESWIAADHWVVGKYIILPDHIHLFCSPAKHDHLPLQAWVRFWKSYASKAWSTPKEHPLWQQHGWDTQLRKGDSYSAKWEYVRNNPVRHKLAT